MKILCFGDIEASGLALQSYPIEIAWSCLDGDIQARLIRTHESWGDYWDPAAEALHHINSEMLRAEGIPVTEVALEMNRDLNGETLYFDGGDYDRCWLGQIFTAAGIDRSFKLGDFETLLASVGIVESSRRAAAEALARKDIGDLQLHRAANDVKFLQRLYIRARGCMRR